MINQIDTRVFENLTGQLLNYLQVYHADWGVKRLDIAGSGLESVIYRAKTVSIGEIAIRVPKNRWLSGSSWVSANNNDLDSRVFLRQEAMFSSYLRAYGIPTPIIYALHLGVDGLDFMVSSFIEHDGSKPHPQEFGQLIRSLHSSPPPNIPFALNGNVAVNDFLAKRLLQRLNFISSKANIALQHPPLDEIHMMLEWPESRQCILHMDARPENVLTRDGNIVAFIDWSSALLADPALELMRIAEYGLLCSSFLQGYNDHDCLARIPRIIELLYRLDTAAMLAVVFMAEAPDHQRATNQINRVLKLCNILYQESGCN